jgi:hypothetical protein
MKKLLIVAFSLLAVLCGIAVYNKSSPSAQGKAQTQPNPLPASKVEGITPAKTTTVIAKSAAGAKPVSPAGIPSPQPTPKSEEKANDVEMVKKNMDLLQEVSLAVTELPEVKAGIARVWELHGEFDAATSDRKTQINEELKRIKERHTEIYRKNFREVGLPESIVQGIEITLPQPKPPAQGTATPPVAPKPAPTIFQ